MTEPLLTRPAATPLEQGVSTPWKLRVDWLCHDAYGADVVVELHRADEEPVVVSSFPTYEGAMDSAIGYLADRGFGYWINEDLHRRERHSHLTLHPIPVD